MDFVGDAKRLEDEDIRLAAQRLDCDEATIRAVAEVESRGSGFLDDGRPKILFEAHIFSRQTEHAFDESHPDISSRRWNGALYGQSGAHQYKRLREAMALDEDAALRSTSWGMFQVMGFNFEACGYSSIEDFVEAMKRGEGDHLHAMTEYVRHYSLDQALRDHDWASFARGYNGPGFSDNGYDVKLAQAWLKYAEGAG